MNNFSSQYNSSKIHKIISTDNNVDDESYNTIHVYENLSKYTMTEIIKKNDFNS